MPGPITRITEIINGQMPSSSAAFVRVLGTAYPIDPFLKGTTRFARKIGDLIPLIMAENTTSLLFDVALNEDEIGTVEFVPWIKLGSKLLIQNSELVTVADFTVDSNKRIMRIQLEERLKAPHPAASKVLLFGHPIEVLSVTVQNPLLIVVRSDLRIYELDTIALGFVNYPLSAAVLAGEVDGFFTYQLALQPGVTVPASRLPVTGDTIHLRAFPAYASQPLCIPTIPPSQKGLGPFCVDWFSGVTVEDFSQHVNEKQLLIASDVANQTLYSKRIEKNYLVLQTPIRNDALLFWDLLRGKLNWNGVEVLCYFDVASTPDAQGVPAFQLHYKCVPPWVADGQVTQWKIPVTNDNSFAVQLTIQLDPQAPVSIVIPANTTHSLLLNFPVGSPTVERVWLGLNPMIPDPNDPTSLIPGDPGGVKLPLKLKTWYINANAVAFLQNVMVTEVEGRFLWGSTGLFVKPTLLSVEYLKARVDINGFVNNGLMALGE